MELAGDIRYMGDIPLVLWDGGSPEQRAVAVQIADSLLTEGVSIYSLIESATVLIESGNQSYLPRIAQRFADDIEKATGDRDSKGWAMGLVGAMCDDCRHPNSAAWATEFLGRTLDPLGCNGRELVSAWAMSGPNPAAQIRKNIEALNSLEQAEPGIIHYLVSECGVRDVARYPTDLLLNQFRQRDDLTTPYGLIVYPRADWNGAFNFGHAALSQIQSEVGGQFLIRIVECDTKMGIARRLIGFNKKYGKVSFGVLAGHGSPVSIAMGEGGDPLASLRIRDFRGDGVKRIHQYFMPGAELTLLSCSTGFEGGIGERLSQITDTRLTAPVQPSNITSFHARISDGRVHFQPEYVGGAPMAQFGYKKGPEDVPAEVLTQS